MKPRFEEALRRFDKVHQQDPRKILLGKHETSWSLLYHERLTHWVNHLQPDASEGLRLAARCQHIQRWHIPRNSYPMNRAGYKRWRKDLAKFHSELAERILRDVGYPPETIIRVQALLRKIQLKRDPEVQLFEDAICLVFLENELSDFAHKHEKEKLIGVLKKTWQKMSPEGHRAALKLVDDLPADLRELLNTSLSS